MSLRQKFIIAIFFFMVLVSGLFFVFFTALYSKALILQENNVSGFGYLITEMIELIRQHHPHMQDNEIRLLLNRASDDFCAKTELIKHSFSLGIDVDPDDTTANKRYYSLPSEILTIREVYLNK